MTVLEHALCWLNPVSTLHLTLFLLSCYWAPRSVIMSGAQQFTGLTCRLIHLVCCYPCTLTHGFIWEAVIPKCWKSHLVIWRLPLCFLKVQKGWRHIDTATHTHLCKDYNFTSYQYVILWSVIQCISCDLCTVSVLSLAESGWERKGSLRAAQSGPALIIECKSQSLLLWQDTVSSLSGAQVHSSGEGFKLTTVFIVGNQESLVVW